MGRLRHTGEVASIHRCAKGKPSLGTVIGSQALLDGASPAARWAVGGEARSCWAEARRYCPSLVAVAVETLVSRVWACHHRDCCHQARGLCSCSSRVAAERSVCEGLLEDNPWNSRQSGGKEVCPCRGGLCRWMDEDKVDDPWTRSLVIVGRRASLNQRLRQSTIRDQIREFQLYSTISPSSSSSSCCTSLVSSLIPSSTGSNIAHTLFKYDTSSP